MSSLPLDPSLAQHLRPITLSLPSGFSELTNLNKKRQLLQEEIIACDKLVFELTGKVEPVSGGKRKGKPWFNWLMIGCCFSFLFTELFSCFSLLSVELQDKLNSLNELIQVKEVELKVLMHGLDDDNHKINEKGEVNNPLHFFVF